MSITINCDFCGTQLAADYRRPGISVFDTHGSCIQDYDACDECASLTVQMLERRKGMLYVEEER